MKRHLPEDMMARRIETSTGAGHPDVIMSRSGYQCLVELKALQSWSNTFELTAIQRSVMKKWMRAGLCCYVLGTVQRPGAPDILMLIRGDRLKPRAMNQWMDDSLFTSVGNRITWGTWALIFEALERDLAQWHFGHAKI